MGRAARSKAKRLGVGLPALPSPPLPRRPSIGVHGEELASMPYQKLSMVNGVLFTGGSEKQGVYFETIKKGVSERGSCNLMMQPIHVFWC
ncbi:hypothetical protein PVAP13_1KG141077 [Panicum virgatum]|uniref:Uncharacterized protein n=1 Tax=Panicum virgatum TaxID=38727 RepID=A0A8T0XBQ5_PANVG|nr:hypothetical protein PVAP13_1KG141077 [Panicum virgatum]